MKKRLGFWLSCLLALGALSGLALVRLWAVLGQWTDGTLILLLALVLAGGCVALVVRSRRAVRAFLPWGVTWKTALLAAVAFALGAACDTSFAMFSSDGLLIGTAPFRLLAAMGSGLVFAAIVLALVKAARGYGSIRGSSVQLMLVLALVVNIATAIYCAGSATVYYWDNAIYWNSSSMLAAQPLDFAQIRLVLESVITQEYNYLLSFPISLVMRLWGTGRYIYLFSISNLYVLPAMWGLCVLSRKNRHGGLLLILLSPMLLYAGLVGFVDVAAAGLGIWAFAIYTDTERPAVPRGLLAGALLTGTFLLRRYFFFFAVSFGLAALLAQLIVQRKRWREFIALFCATAVTGLFFAQSFLIEKVLSMRYGDIYSAYNQGRRVDFIMLARYFGLVLLAVAAALGIYLLVKKGAARRWSALLAMAQFALCLFLFTRIQSHGQQHLLLYLPAFAYLLASGLAALPRTRPVAVCATLLAVCTTVSALLPRVQTSHPQNISLPAPMPSFSYAPPRRSDMASLVALRIYVDGLSAKSSKTAAVVASSFVFNDSIYNNILRSANIPQPDTPQTKISYMGTVDKRDAFSWSVLKVDYLLVGDPVQTHLGEENQRLVTLLANDVLHGEGLGAAYRELESRFVLDGGVTVRIFERTREVTAQECRTLSDQLVALYPDYAAQYQFFA